MPDRPEAAGAGDEHPLESVRQVWRQLHADVLHQRQTPAGGADSGSVRQGAGAAAEVVMRAGHRVRHGFAAALMLYVTASLAACSGELKLPPVDQAELTTGTT